MNKFSDENIQILIDLVREKPMFYDKGDRNYKKNELKDKVWKEIGKKLNSNGKLNSNIFRPLHVNFNICLRKRM